MELGPHHLRMIDAIAATRSISKAAARLNITQPAVSTMLRRVESHLGVRLFTRSPEGVALTSVGREVATRARAVLSGIDDLNAAVAKKPRGGPGKPRLRFGAQACPALNRLSEHLGMLFPTARVQLRVDQSGGRVLPLLASGALDVGLVHEPLGRPASTPADVERLVLLEEPALLGLSERHPLAAEHEVSLSELATYEWVDDPLDDGPWPAYLRQACAAAGFSPRVSFWSANWQLSTSLVCAGRAVGLFHPTSRPVPGLTFRRLRDDPLGHRVVLLWRPEAAAAARRLRTALGQIHVELARANPLYARWWDEHPEAHPAHPALSVAAAGEEPQPEAV